MKFVYNTENRIKILFQNKARTLCNAYQESNKKDKEQILRILAFRYAVEHTVVCNVAEKYVSTEVCKLLISIFHIYNI